MAGPTPAPFKDATALKRGFMGIGAQVFEGIKTFLKPIKLAMFSTGTMPALTEGHIAYDTTLHRAVVHTNTGWIPVVLSVSGDDVGSLTEHLLDPTGAHAASALSVASPLPSWADGSTPIYSTVQAAIVGLITDLINAEGSESGAGRIGAEPGGNRSANTILGQLSDLDSFIVTIGNARVTLAALAAATGATLVGCSGGVTLQFALDSLSYALNTKASSYDTGIAKAWGFFVSGSSPTLYRGKNVASFSYPSANVIRVTFTTPMSTTQYSVTGGVSDSNGKLAVMTRNQNYVELADYHSSSTSYANINTGGVTFDFNIHE